MTDRTSLSSLQGRTIALIERAPSGAILFKDEKSEAFLMIRHDEVFDGDGNYFDDDVQ